MARLLPLFAALALWAVLAVVRDREQAREVAAEQYVQTQAFMELSGFHADVSMDVQRAHVAFLAEHVPAFRDTLVRYDAEVAELERQTDTPRMRRITDHSAHLARIEARLGVTRVPEAEVVRQVRAEGPGREGPLQGPYEIRRSGLAGIPPVPFHALFAVLALVGGLFAAGLRPLQGPGPEGKRG